MNPPPYKLRLEAFNRVAYILGAALRTYPLATKVEAELGITPETLREYIWRGIKAKQVYGYKHPAVDEHLFKTHSHSLVCSIEGNVVYIGSKEEVKKKVGVSPITPTPSNEIKVTTADMQTLRDLCRLVALRIMEPAPVFVITVMPYQATDLEETNDIALQEKGDGSWRIL